MTPREPQSNIGAKASWSRPLLSQELTTTRRQTVSF